MMFPMYERFAAEGLLPNLKKLADAGIVGEAYPSMPVWTPTNWTTLATGAHTGTHSVSRWFLNLPTPRHEEQTLSAFIRPAAAAENVFEAAAKAALKSVAIHYPRHHRANRFSPTSSTGSAIPATAPLPSRSHPRGLY